MIFPRLCLLWLTIFALTLRPARADDAATQAKRPLLLAHYMPWFSAPPHSPTWGWHWTMNAFAPDQITGGKRAIASHYYPLVGPYDSGDAEIVEHQLLTMKLAGIDGVIVDWYGRTDHFDYAPIHRNSELVLRTARRLGLKFAVCYEDQTIPILVKAGKIKESERVAHAAEEIAWLEANWFADPAYLSHEGKPVWLSFGNAGLSDAEWEQVLTKRAMPSLYLSEHRRRAGADGAFDWPIPNKGAQAVESFIAASQDWPLAMPVAFARFHDIYGAAKVHDSYAIIPGEGGRTLKNTLRLAMQSGAPWVQIATWNDWGEGTQIEPSREFGLAQLQTIQRARRESDANFPFDERDLELPNRLWQQRQLRSAEALSKIKRALVAGDMTAAGALLEQMEMSKGDAAQAAGQLED